MALFFECMLQCARKVLDSADIVREAWLRHLANQHITGLTFLSACTLRLLSVLAVPSLHPTSLPIGFGSALEGCSGVPVCELKSSLCVASPLDMSAQTTSPRSPYLKTTSPVLILFRSLSSGSSITVRKD
jgi:hypothetical protein